MVNRKSLWRRAESASILSQNEVHVWRASLDCGDETLDRLGSLLSEDEWQRARRFYFDRDRRHFIAARGLLRTLLARYLGWDPSLLAFGYTDKGKPSLVTTSPGGLLQFNLSHSYGRVLYALTLGREVGVDLEYLRLVKVDALAQRFFSDREAAAIAEEPETEKQTLFFKLWTAKEAYLKATGEGLAGLSRVELEVTGDRQVRLKQIANNPYLTSLWSLYCLDPEDGYLGAIAVRGDRLELSCWEFDGNFR
ncbi:4'-phosphopantetheinyl transferase family protein [Oxynema aestuarii]|uniref:4'-phosphopantetheinyl transferase superfamily protein n=1 Tax=Oxynema aestuarii AP17 TaxID=2064643 RepID=A0A6H1U3H6_9CYAN|nr:4'-phosphopantetheinyl transferase superfamily protein [Oxynema aestuarii]QIZ73438.1 4'-phosphopantetheinyl transferase superfamily protein [Oxynema aestuarii AP17]